MNVWRTVPRRTDTVGYEPMEPFVYDGRVYVVHGDPYSERATCAPLSELPDWLKPMARPAQSRSWPTNVSGHLAAMIYCAARGRRVHAGLHVRAYFEEHVGCHRSVARARELYEAAGLETGARAWAPGTPAAITAEYRGTVRGLFGLCRAHGVLPWIVILQGEASD